jgi:SNF family Na+-dependent transporter
MFGAWGFLAIIIPLLYLTIIGLVAYWVIRKGIAHGLAEYDRKKSSPTAGQ